jgi:hypothetical protein
MAKLGREALLAWGRDFEQQLRVRGKDGLHIPLDILGQYLALANDAIEQLKVSTGKRPAHRPKGTGAGAQVEALVATGLAEDDAKRVVAQGLDKTSAQIDKALRWHRGPRKASKKSRVPRQGRRKTRSS